MHTSPQPSSPTMEPSLCLMSEVMADTTRVLCIQPTTSHDKACTDDGRLRTLPCIAERSTQNINRRAANNVELICTQRHAQL